MYLTWLEIELHQHSYRVQMVNHHLYTNMLRDNLQWPLMDFQQHNKQDIEDFAVLFSYQFSHLQL